MGEGWSWDDDSYLAVARAGLDWQHVLDVLDAHPRIVQQLGAIRRIVGRDRTGRWLVVVAIEQHGDDEFLLVSARVLHPDEAIAAQAMIDRQKGGQ